MMPTTQSYPMPLFAEGEDDVFVGRIRKDPDHPTGFHMWVVTDNLIKRCCTQFSANCRSS